eukprot:353206-Chlamydomonas_euryale.AAC.4
MQCHAHAPPCLWDTIPCATMPMGHNPMRHHACGTPSHEPPCPCSALLKPPDLRPTDLIDMLATLPGRTAQLDAKIADWRAEREAEAASSAAHDADAGAAPAPPAASVPTSTETSVLRVLSVFTQLFPLWCVLVAVAGFYCPPLFTWFDTSMTTNGLMFIMVSLGQEG